MLHGCCCCCDKSKRKVDADVDDSDPSEPLLISAREEFAKKEEPRSSPKRGSLLVQNSIGDLQIDSDDGSLSDYSGGAPNPLNFTQKSKETHVIMGHSSFRHNSSMVDSVNSVGDINIPDQVLDRQKSLETLKRDVSIAAAKKSSQRNLLEQSKKVQFQGDGKEGAMAKKLEEVKRKKEKKKYSFVTEDETDEDEQEDEDEQGDEEEEEGAKYEV